jgi:O-antigen ligase
MKTGSVTENANRLIKEFNWAYIPFFIIVFIIPLIVFHIPVMHNAEMATVLLKTRWHDDYYSLIKVIFLYFSTVLLFIVFFLKNGPWPCFHKSFYLLIVYALLVLLSMYFSEYRISALFGIVDHYEGGITQLCYGFILVLSYYLAGKLSNIITVLKLMTTGSVIVAFVGLLQFLGVIGTDLPYTVSSTIGNSNYVGTYAVLLLPAAFALVLIEQSKARKVLYVLTYFGAAFFLLVGSMSRAGYLGFIAEIIILLVLLRWEIRAQIKWVLLLLAYCLVLFVLMNAFSKGLMWEEVKSINPLKTDEQQERLVFKDIVLNNSSAFIETNQWYMEVKSDGQDFGFYDKNGKEIPSISSDKGQTINFVKWPYSNIEAFVTKQEELAWLMLKFEKNDLEFVHINGRLRVVGYNGRLTGIEPVESFGFKGKESFASGRGYIWSRAIPLLKKAFVIGYGPDTFTFIFPQNDIVGKLNYGAIWVIIGKPHSWYLQIALGSGVISLLLLLALIIWYFSETIGSIKNINKDIYQGIEKNSNKIITATILLSVIGCCVTCIFNDSVVAVSPIFWMLLGFGIRVNSLWFKAKANI